ncbi:hypothetical protein NHQ30_008596 [Ciborinia camelliae]|nr:hypothetical protein NHQ30_008596 [Ciborinia camelliae]
MVSNGFTTKVYKLPEHQVDVNIRIFSYEIQCHSLILKLGSAYFRKFLDSADKSPAPADATFKYQYVTIQDDPDEVPSLEVANKVEDRGDKPTETGPDHWYLAIKHMIDCMYGKSFILTDTLHLASIVKVADFYRALPVVSRTLDGVLVNSPLLIEQIPDHAGPLLKIAYQLRNQLLYRECMVHVAGRYGYERLVPEADMQLSMRIIVAYAGVEDKLDKAHRSILRVSGRQVKSGNCGMSQKLQSLSATYKTLPQHYRTLYEDVGWGSEFQPLLSVAMRNNLILDRSKVGAGQGKFKEYFLCAEVTDEELPWDQEEEDW